MNDGKYGTELTARHILNAANRGMPTWLLMRIWLTPSRLSPVAAGPDTKHRISTTFRGDLFVDLSAPHLPQMDTR